MVQCLRLAVGSGSPAGLGTKIPHAAQQGQKIKKNFKFLKRIYLYCILHVRWYVLSHQSSTLLQEFQEFSQCHSG